MTEVSVYAAAGVAAGAAAMYLRQAMAGPRGTEWKEDPAGGKVTWTRKKHTAVSPDAELEINLGSNGLAAMEPTTVCKIFSEVRRSKKDCVALQKEDPNGGWQTWTWGQYGEEVDAVARAFIKLGFKRHHAANIIGFNSPQWLFADIAAILAGGKAAGIYTTNNPQQCLYIAEHSEASIIVVENGAQLNKYIEILGQLKFVKAIIVYDDDAAVSGDAMAKVSASGKQLLTWGQLIALGNDSSQRNTLQQELELRQSQQKPGHCCTLIYTSGTTGPPKAVMCSHDNVTWTAATANTVFPSDLLSGEQHGVSYLPLSHIAAQMLDIHVPMYTSATNPGNSIMTFARPDALKGTLKDTLAKVRPTWFFGVPRVWEKMMEAMVAAGKAAPSFARKIAQAAKSVGLAKAKTEMVGGRGAKPLLSGLFDKLAYSKVKARLGLDRCALMYSAAAPISKETLEYFASLDLHILELYGMSECTGPETVSTPGSWCIGSCGPTLSGVEIKLEHMDGRDKPGQGEICMRGRHIMMGYMKDQAKTDETIDKDGWLHSGDVGSIDKYGNLRITGRIKELIITAGGENIAPVPVEDAIKAYCSALSNVVMVGDKRKFCTALITLKTKPDAEGVPTDQLDGAAKEVNASCTTVQQAMSDKTWNDYIQDGINKYNKNDAVSTAQKIQKFKILDHDFSIASGELTATLKLKRSVVMEQRSADVESMY